MTAPLNIMAAALDRVQMNPEASSLPAQSLAERAALLVLAQVVPVDGQLPKARSNPLLEYVQQVQRAKDGLRHALAALDLEEAPTPADAAALMANFDRAQDVYYQATAGVAELVRRILEVPADHPVSAGVDDGWDRL